MRVFRTLPLLLSLLATPTLADGLYQIEVIVFRQAGEAVSASQTAPEDWAVGTQPIAGSERPLQLEAAAAKLGRGSGYQVLLHKAWSQSLSSLPSRVAISTGNEQFGHFPVEGALGLSEQERLVDLDADIWVNQFDANGQLSGSERLKQRTRLKNGELTYLDHNSLGVLVKVSPLESTTP